MCFILVNHSIAELYVQVSPGIYYIVIKGVSGVASAWGPSLYAYYSLSTSAVSVIPFVSFPSDVLPTFGSLNYSLTNGTISVSWNNTVKSNLTPESFWQNYSPLYFITLAGHPVVAQFEAACSGLTFPVLASQTMHLPMNYWNKTLMPYPINSEELRNNEQLDYHEGDLNNTGVYMRLALKIYPKVTDTSQLNNVEPYVTFFYTKQPYYPPADGDITEAVDAIIGVISSVGGKKHLLLPSH